MDRNTNIYPEIDLPRIVKLLEILDEIITVDILINSILQESNHQIKILLVHALNPELTKEKM